MAKIIESKPAIIFLIGLALGFAFNHVILHGYFSNMMEQSLNTTCQK